LSQCTRVTDRQTDGQTDRILLAIPRLHYMQRGNKTESESESKRTTKSLSTATAVFNAQVKLNASMHEVT